ncbi:MAG: hypothetical protein LBS84_08220, partial [Clostridiales bacterium]|nr:hypothetical protein [Clostridiales bacterium]
MAGEVRGGYKLEIKRRAAAITSNETDLIERKDYQENPDKYTGRPKMPGYLPKNGEYNIILTNQNCKLRD